MISNGGAGFGTFTGQREGPKLVQIKSGISSGFATFIAAMATPPPAENLLCVGHTAH